MGSAEGTVLPSIIVFTIDPEMEVNQSSYGKSTYDLFVQLHGQGGTVSLKIILKSKSSLQNTLYAIQTSSGNGEIPREPTFLAKDAQNL
jgi:hypothetical protein